MPSAPPQTAPPGRHLPAADAPCLDALLAQAAGVDSRRLRHLSYCRREAVRVL